MLIEVLNWAKYNPKETGYWWRMECTWAMDPAISVLDSKGKLIWVALMTFACQCSSGRYDLDMGLLCSVYGVDMEALCATLNHLKVREKIKIPTLRGRYTRTNVRTYERTNKEKSQKSATPPPDDLLLLESGISKPQDAVMKFTQWDMLTAQGLQQAILEHNPAAKRVKRVDLGKWANELRVMRERDELDQETIEVVLRALFSADDPLFIADPFWRVTVQSPAALRKYWDRISALINNPKPIKAAGGFKL